LAGPKPSKVEHVGNLQPEPLIVDPWLGPIISHQLQKMEDCKALLPEQLPVLLNKISGTRWKKSQVELALEQLQKETSQRFKEVEKRENNFRDLSMEHCSR